MLTAFMLTGFRARLACLAAAVACVTLVGCERVPLLAPAGSTLTLTSSATTLPINGSTTLVAQVLEAAGTAPQSGTHVTFTTTLGTIRPAEAETDSGGRVVVIFSAGDQSGTATITALSGAASTGTTGAVKIAVGAAAVGRVIVNANPALVPANGGQSTISAVVLDVNGNALPFAPVAFTTTAGTLTFGVINSDLNGVASTVLTTSTAATVTASVGATGGSGTGTGGGNGNRHRRRNGNHDDKRPGVGLRDRRHPGAADARDHSADHAAERRPAGVVHIHRYTAGSQRQRREEPDRQLG